MLPHQCQILQKYTFLIWRIQHTPNDIFGESKQHKIKHINFSL